MASNVFGNAIINSTLVGLPGGYSGMNITPTDRAYLAINMKNAEEKDVSVRKYVENLNDNTSDTGASSTLCLVYNATGDTLTLVTSHDYHGHIGRAPYPQVIANGQWGGYLHVSTGAGDGGSSAGVVYRGKNEAGARCDWMLAWSNAWDGENKAYTQIRKRNHFNGDAWTIISGLLSDSGLQHSDKWNGCFSTVTTGCHTSPILEAILTLEDAV